MNAIITDLLEMQDAVPEIKDVSPLFWLPYHGSKIIKDKPYVPIFCSYEKAKAIAKATDEDLYNTLQLKETHHKTTVFWLLRGSSEPKELKLHYSVEEYKTIKEMAALYYNTLPFEFILRIKAEQESNKRAAVILFEMKLFKNYNVTSEGIGICYHDLAIALDAETGMIVDIIERSVRNEGGLYNDVIKDLIKDN